MSGSIDITGPAVGRAFIKDWKEKQEESRSRRLQQFLRSAKIEKLESNKCPKSDTPFYQKTPLEFLDEGKEKRDQSLVDGKFLMTSNEMFCSRHPLSGQDKEEKDNELAIIAMKNLTDQLNAMADSMKLKTRRAIHDTKKVRNIMMERAEERRRIEEEARADEVQEEFKRTSQEKIKTTNTRFREGGPNAMGQRVRMQPTEKDGQVFCPTEVSSDSFGTPQEIKEGVAITPTKKEKDANRWIRPRMRRNPDASEDDPERIFCTTDDDPDGIDPDFYHDFRDLQKMNENDVPPSITRHEAYSRAAFCAKQSEKECGSDTTMRGPFGQDYNSQETCAYGQIGDKYSESVCMTKFAKDKPQNNPYRRWELNRMGPRERRIQSEIEQERRMSQRPTESLLDKRFFARD